MSRPSLTELANAAGSDKGDVHRDAHHYTRIYDPLLTPWRDQPLKMLEIGLLHWEDDRWVQRSGGTPYKGRGKAVGSAAPSLGMWTQYFPHAEVHGLDINDFSSVSLPRVTIHRGDSSDPADLADVMAFGPFDLIIDDGSHASFHQQIALGILWPALKPGGIYIVEDMHYQPEGLEREDTPKTRDLFNAFLCCGRFDTPHITPEAGRAVAADLDEMMLFDTHSPNYVFNGRDALAVLRRKA